MSASSASTSSMVWVNTGYGLTFAALALLAGYKLVSYRNTMVCVLSFPSFPTFCEEKGISLPPLPEKEFNGINVLQ